MDGLLAGLHMKQSIHRYTTTISATKTLQEITRMLSEAKASAILTELADGRPTAISFRVQTSFGLMTFRLPGQVREVDRILAGSRLIPPRLRTLEQAERVAWRIIRDWLESQLAMVQAGLVAIEQVFLPYAQGPDGTTLYERLKEQRFAGLLHE
jgi:hypothetical protein